MDNLPNRYRAKLPPLIAELQQMQDWIELNQEYESQDVDTMLVPAGYGEEELGRAIDEFFDEVSTRPNSKRNMRVIIVRDSQ